MLFPIISNCNFESRDDREGQIIHNARMAVENGLIDDADLQAALEALEETLSTCAEQEDLDSVRRCRDAERAVVMAFRSLGPTIGEEGE